MVLVLFYFINFLMYCEQLTRNMRGDLTSLQPVSAAIGKQGKLPILYHKFQNCKQFNKWRVFGRTKVEIDFLRFKV